MSNGNGIATEEVPTFRLQHFEGPLDLLLHLVREAQVSIYDIPIAQITEQYLAYLAASDAVDLEYATSFFVMAASLLLIKSRMLLPVEVNLQDELEDPRQELIEQLIAYQKFRALSSLIAERWEGGEIPTGPRREDYPWPLSDDVEVSLDALVKLFHDLTEPASPGEQLIPVYDEVTVNEKVTLVRELLELVTECRFTDLLRTRRPVDVVCALLAVLEMAKMRFLRVLQERPFADLILRRRESEVR